MKKQNSNGIPFHIVHDRFTFPFLKVHLVLSSFSRKERKKKGEMLFKQGKRSRITRKIGCWISCRDYSGKRHSQNATWMHRIYAINCETARWKRFDFALVRACFSLALYRGCHHNTRQLCLQDIPLVPGRRHRRRRRRRRRVLHVNLPPWHEFAKTNI